MKQLRYTEWSPLTWHGIGLSVPADWNPGKIIGDWKSGSLRLDDSEIVRLELEWKEARGDTRVTQIVDRYVEGLAKNAQKQKQGLNVERHPEEPTFELEDVKSVEYFVWETDYRVYTLACYSALTDRLVFIRVMARLTEDLTAALPTIFGSLKDTPTDQPQPWALYDLRFTSPPGYELETYELKSGHIRFRFIQGRNSLQIDRLSLAAVLLKNRSLADWYEDFFRKDLRHAQYEIEPTDTAGHTGLRLTGNPRSRWRTLLAPLPFWNVRPRLYVGARAWSCVESNKIYAVHGYWRKAETAPDIEACSRDIPCHGQDTPSYQAQPQP